MQFLQKNQITHLIRDTIAVYALNLAATDYLIDINNSQLRYAIIIIITLSLIYCSFKCFSALIEIILKLIIINNHFLNYKRNTQYLRVIPTAILYFFIYLYLILLNIDALEVFNKIDFYLLIFKAVTF